MPTSTASRKAALIVAAALLVAGLSADAKPANWLDRLDGDELELVGFAGHVPDTKKPKVTAFFPLQSYAPGATAELRIVDSAPRVAVRLFRAGMDPARIAANDVLTGRPVTKARPIGAVDGARTVRVHLGHWPSGLYYAQLTAPGGRVGYATFVLRPERLGVNRVAVVLPTLTWQAYNFRDDNGDGVPDTWYVHGSTASMSRPYFNRGVPPHYKYYDARFLAWVHLNYPDTDVISDAELQTHTGEELRSAYQLLVFEGHHEYVTQHEYDAVKRYRDLGGNLMFLSANNFFWKVTIAGTTMTRVAKWRDLGQPEASLIGVAYYKNDMGEHRGAWVVTSAGAKLPWLGLTQGAELSNGGIEADEVTDASPRNVKVVASIPNLYGDGHNADMTYYETPAGAKVFAAGAFTIAGSVWQRDVFRLVSSLWLRLSEN